MKNLAILMRLEDFEDTTKWFINATYCKAIQQLHWGMYPICSYESLQIAKESCDALCIPGGYDIHGSYINENLSKKSTCYNNFMDHFELDCIQAFNDLKKPILGICRGMQTLNIYYGGSLLQHINDEQHAPNHTHTIQLPKRSPLRQIYNNHIVVNSYHHQVIGKLGKGLFSAAFSEEMYVEAIMHQNKRILGVQWHPEKMENDQIFAYFFDIICCR